jgi:rhamnopyranosyl-N-acetylglucosaminyl-diphospho-decaprenol beta-1,3/1,4-galactofuranosyltransferase
VAVVVVTFRRKPKLRQCIGALLSQTRLPDRILIVDNGGDVTLADVLDSDSATPVTVGILQPGHNAGPAGGFACGIEAVLEDRPEWLWLMDDDVMAEAGALEALLASSCPAAINWPLVLDSAGRESVFPAWTGLLVHASKLREAGLPRADLFWWAEDTEYIRWRLERGLEMTPVRNRQAVVHHLRAERRGVKPAWKYYYEVRNDVYVAMHYRDKERFWKIPRNVLRQMARVIYRDRQRVLWKLGLIARGARDGFIGSLGRTIPPTC